MKYLGVVWLVLSAGCLFGGPPPSPPRGHAHALEVSSFALDNGLRVVVVNDPRASQLQVTMGYRVGAGDDPPTQPGMAHLVEHLLHDQVVEHEPVYERLEDLATYFNAHTGVDRTTFIARARPGHLEQLLALEASRLDTPCASIPDAMFERERAVVVNELRQRARSTEVYVAITQALYPEGHPYRRAIGGTPESLATITRDQACAFIDAHYVTTNAALVISGNVSRPQVEAALTQQLARIRRREDVRVIPAPTSLASGSVHVSTSLDNDALVIAWPLPRDPADRAAYRAVAVAAASRIADMARGTATTLELGDLQMPVVGVLVSAAPDENSDQLYSAAHRALEEFPSTFADRPVHSLEDFAFDRVKQRALFATYAGLEDGTDRDERLADSVLRGHDPALAIREQIRAVDALTHAKAMELARTSVTIDHARLISLDATQSTKRGDRTPLPVTSDDRGQHELAADPAEAHRAAPPPATPEVPGMKTRTLDNGLRVVMLPVTSVPTIECRILFGVGTGDEPRDQRGIALLAATGLGWDPRYAEDLVLFAAAGGGTDVDVSLDQTSFTVRGLGTRLDFLLAGLRRWVLDGSYQDELVSVKARLQRERRRRDDDAIVSDAWRAARYGADHPYTTGGLIRHVSDALTESEIAAFRRAHYAPNNATLIITGRFDPSLVDRWIDYLFENWAGRAERRGAPATRFERAAIAVDDDVRQVRIQLAMPSAVTNRPATLIAAEMLADVARGIRHQLGVSYDLDADLAEHRLASAFVLSGSIDAARAAEALRMLAQRTTELRRDAAVAARAFVIARRRVSARLGAITTNARTLADIVARDAELDRPPLSDLATATALRAVTLEDMSAVLAELDLSRAAVAMRGPHDEVQRAFEVLGRTPRYVSGEAVDPPPEEPFDPRALARPYRNSTPARVDPLTNPRSRWRFQVVPGYAFADVKKSNSYIRSNLCCSGPALALELGRKLGRRWELGARAFVTDVDGYEVDGLLATHDRAFLSVDLAPMLKLRLSGPFWAGAFAGLHVERELELDVNVGVGAGAELGFDVFAVRGHRIGIVAGYQRTFAMPSKLQFWMAGLLLRW